MSPILIVMFVAMELVVTVFVLNRVLAKRGGLAAVLVAGCAGSPPPPATSSARAGSTCAPTGAGTPCSLPGVIEPLLAKLQADLASRGLTVTRSQLLPILEQVILRENLGDPREVREALKRVA